MTSLLERTSFLVGALAYAAATVVFFGQMVRRVDPPGSKGPWLLAIGALGHLIYIGLASMVAKVCPVESIHFALSVAALAATAAYLLARRRWPVDAIGVVVAPLGLGPLLGARLAGIEGGAQRLPPVFLTLHVGVNLIGLALFSLACASAAFYLFVERRLKQKRLASVAGRLPPLDALDRAEHRFLLTGFPLLTLGIITGIVWAHQLKMDGFNDLLWRAMLALVAWVVSGAVLVLRAAADWRGRRAALGTITGFVFAALVLVGYLVRPTAHAAAAPPAAEVRA